MLTENKFSDLKKEINLDWRALHHWREEAREAYAFYSGEQWTVQERNELEAAGRPAVVFNQTGAIIDVVTGNEIKGRSEVAFLPREQGDVQRSELLTGAGEWFLDETDADILESDAFADTIICGLGWTETRLDIDENPMGAPYMGRIDPLEMGFDRHAVGRNLRDGRRFFRVRKITRADARDLAEGAVADADLHAGWLTDADTTKADVDNPGDDYEKDDYADESVLPSDGLVTVVQVQWRERKTLWLAEETDPATGRMVTQEFDEKKKSQIERFRPDISFVKIRRWEINQAFLGRKVLAAGKAATQKGFTFQAITGKRDRNKGRWYGLMRAMKDPQKLHNKTMSLMAFLLSVSAKGGVIAEEGLTHDHAGFEREYAAPGSVTWVPDGALSGANGSKRLEVKPTAPVPPGLERLLVLAKDAVSSTTGVNAEMIGLKDAQQSGVLEYQRREAALTVLTSLFDSLRAYRKRQGRVLLEFITEYLTDGRLIRIAGEDGAKYVPLVREEGVAEYDVIVDESSSSPNAKEKAWSAIKELLPTVGPMFGKREWTELAKYSPLPSALVEKLGQSDEQPDPVAEEMRKLQLAAMQAGVQKDQAEAAKDMAQAHSVGQGAAAEIALDIARADRERAETEIMRRSEAPVTTEVIV